MTYIVWIGGIDNHYKTKEEANEAVEDVILEAPLAISSPSVGTGSEQ